jgi:site-specific recombinase XerD
MERERLLRAFSEHWRTLGYAEMTLDNYLRCVKRLPDPLDEITTLDLTEQLAKRRHEVGDAALAYEVRAFKAFYSWLADTLEKPNPARNLKTPKVDEPPVRSISLEALRALLATCGPTRQGDQVAADGNARCC